MGAVLLTAPRPSAAGEADFAAGVERLCAEHLSLWAQLPARLPELGPSIGFFGHLGNARGAARLVDAVAVQIESLPDGEEERSRWRERLRARILAFGEERLSWPAGYARLPFGEAYVDAALAFARGARAFDPTLRLEELWQALRNVGIGNTLQVLLGLAVELRPGLFAYSLLYPLTDNLLDDPGVATESKRGFNERFGRRLAGQAVQARTVREEDVFRLVACIEGELPRRWFGDLYRSLLAIHRAQDKSLRQQQDPGLSDADVLAISCEKGGASVLADLFLVRGRPSAAERRFAFGYGFFLQLLDDLQDVGADLRAGHQTLFTRAARRGCLDEPAGRLAHLIDRVLDDAATLGGGADDARIDLVRRSCRWLLVGSIAAEPERFSRRFRAGVAGRWPFALSGIRRLRRRARRRFTRAAERLRRRSGAASLLELLADTSSTTPESQRFGRSAWYGPRSATGS